MFDANSNRIRFATEEDAHALRRLAEQSSQRPLAGRVLIGQIDGTPAAALSLEDGRAIAGRSYRTDHLVATLRMRAGAIRAYESTPALSERLRAAFSAYSGSDAKPASVSRIGDAGHAPERIAA
jgi:hypothetical protein